MRDPVLAELRRQRYRECHPERVLESARKASSRYRARHAEKVRRYNLALYHRRRRDWLKANGPCRYCGSSRRLEVDHIDPALKEYKAVDIWRRSDAVRASELAKCQVLCRKCHDQKSGRERSERARQRRNRATATA